jgi:hypothetical protein
MTRQKLARSELKGLHSVLRRAAERAERNREFILAEQLADELMQIEISIEKADER